MKIQRGRAAEIIDYLVVYDEPQVLLLKSSRQNHVLAVAVQYGQMSRPFFACEARDKPFERYFDQKADLRYVFHHAMSERYYIFDLDDEAENKVTLKPLTAEEARNESLWPKAGFFARSHTSAYHLKRIIGAAIQRFKIDGNWGSDDFTQFHSRMSDLYALFAVLKGVDLQTQSATLASVKQSIQEKFWQGGGSYVGFYDGLLKHVRGSINPLDVAAIRYASPGEIKFRGDKDALSEVARVIMIFEEMDHQLHAAYRKIYGALQKDHLLSADRNAGFSSKALEDFVRKETFDLANAMGLEKTEDLFAACDENLLIFAKVILSIYRRAKQIYNFHVEGRVQAVAGLETVI
jgi:hypothetical protein